VNLYDVDTFGGLDADTDRLLETCFENHEAYTSAMAHQHYLVLGRKGSGKTAIFRKIINTNQPDVFSLGLTFADYPWHHHDKQESVGVPEEERFVHSWKYLILLSLSKVLLNNDQSQPWCDEAVDQLSKIERFIVDSYGTKNPDITQIFIPHKVLQFNAFLEVTLGAFKGSLGAKPVPVEELPTIISEVNTNLSNAVIASLNPELDYYICFDQLDLGFNPLDNKYRNRLVGLILAARDINLKAKQSQKKLSVIVFLRDDIYQTLRFEDKNKITEGFMSRIEWDTSRTKTSLKQLMEKRISTKMGIPEKDSWDATFDENELMTGRQSKYNHIIDRSFLRPRDIIKCCNEILGAYKKRIETPLSSPKRSSDKFDNRDIQAAHIEYSRYFLNELDDEIFKHIPGYENYIEILKNLDSLQFTIEDFNKALEKRKQLLAINDNPALILKNLFDFSIISYYSPGGGGYGGAEYVWKYKDPRAQFNEIATSFRVHPGFKEALGLRRYTRSD
jgi:hypothetical protein